MNRKAFTLIELLVVVAIIGILAAVGVVAYNGYTASARKAVAQTNFDIVVKTITYESNFCLWGSETHILNRAAATKINPRGTPIIDCLKAFNNTEDLVRAFHPIFNSMKIRNPHPNAWDGKPGGYDLNVGAFSYNAIHNIYFKQNGSTNPGLIMITSISPNKTKKSI